MANQQPNQENLGNQGQKNPIQNPNQGEQKDFANQPGKQNQSGQSGQNQSGQQQQRDQGQQTGGERNRQ